MDEGLEVGTEYQLSSQGLTCRERLGVVKESPYSQQLAANYVVEPANTKIMLSIKKYQDWVNQSTRNDRITYFRGFIMAPHLAKIAPTLDERRVNALKRYVYSSYDGNLVTLVQKRHADFDYEYMAVRL